MKTDNVSISLTFNALVFSITRLDSEFKGQAKRAVNTSLTLRNWAIGYYIEEYEREGVDRAQYGERLIDELAVVLTNKGLSRCDRRELYRYRQFYLLYPQIVETVSPQLLGDRKTVTQKVETVSPQLAHPGGKLIKSLSFSHFSELINLDDALKRVFYEYESIRGNWSVRELRRQIGSLYFERSALSKDKEKLAALVRGEAETIENELDIRDPYIFEFLGVRSKEVMSESALEDSLLDKLQDFLLELGHGFCFEARQKRILIGESQYYVDLVFYHRILKCHILIELKTGEFTHEHIGQLNTYVSWYAKNVATRSDNLPVGILLCTQKDHALMEYALAGMDNSLFVSKYQLNLPEKEEMEQFLLNHLK